MAALPKPDRPPTIVPTTQPVQSARKPGPGDSAADAWEKEEMTSIKERYHLLLLIYTVCMRERERER